MSGYNVALFLHFVGLIGLVAGYSLEWAASGMLRRASTGDGARGALKIYRWSLPISGPGLLVLILSGGYLSTQVAGGMKLAWISAAWLGIIVALVIGFLLILPRVKKIRGALPEGNAALSAELLARVQEPAIFTLVRVRYLLAIGIVALMTLKPESIGIAVGYLVAAMIVGVLFSLPAFSKPKAA